MNYDPNDLACEIFVRQITSGMKDKAVRELAARACQISDIFWTELSRYAASKPKPPEPKIEALEKVQPSP